MKGPGLLSRLPRPRAVSADGLRDVNCGHSSVRSVPSSRLPCVHFLLLASVPTAVTPRRGLEAVFSSHVACLQRPIESPRRGLSWLRMAVPLPTAPAGVPAAEKRGRSEPGLRGSVSVPLGKVFQVPYRCYLQWPVPQEAARKPRASSSWPQPGSCRSGGNACAPGRRTSRLRCLAVLVAPAESLLVNSCLKRHNQNPSQ